MTTAIILLGHGSHISSNTAALIWQTVDHLRTQGIADEVTAAFWKEMPSFHHVLNTVVADDITVVPLFTAQGYFTRTVIPTEMGLADSITHRNERIIRYTPPLSEHRLMKGIVLRYARKILYDSVLPPDQTAIVVIGHSTRRNPESRKAAEEQARQVREAGIAAEVVTVFLDDTPEIAEVYTLTRSPNLLIMPYFLAPGSHTTIDVPRELGLDAGETMGFINGRSVYCQKSLSGYTDLPYVAHQLAIEAGAPLTAALPRSMTHSLWSGFPTAGSEALVERVITEGSMRFGQLYLSREEICVWGDDEPTDVIDSPDVLRARVRENPFRSLATSDDLPTGWRVPIVYLAQIHAVVETIYPGAVADWAAAQEGRLTITPLSELAARQTGMYRAVGSLSEDKQSEMVKRVCSRCVRHPLWFSPAAGGKLPCPEACNHWLSAAIRDANSAAEEES